MPIDYDPDIEGNIIVHGRAEPRSDSDQFDFQLQRFTPGPSRVVLFWEYRADIPLLRRLTGLIHLTEYPTHESASISLGDEDTDIRYDEIDDDEEETDDDGEADHDDEEPDNDGDQTLDSRRHPRSLPARCTRPHAARRLLGTDATRHELFRSRMVPPPRPLRKIITYILFQRMAKEV
jgi:hypothetical protein